MVALSVEIDLAMVVMAGKEDLNPGEEETLLAGRLGIVVLWRIFQAEPPGRT